MKQVIYHTIGFDYINVHINYCTIGNDMNKGISSLNERRLIQVFEENPAPSLNLRKELATTIGVKRNKIDMWFYHRRKKRKRKSHAL